MGEHRLADDVADRVDARHVGPHLASTGMNPRSSTVDAGGGGVDRVAVGLAPDRDEDPVEGLRLAVRELDLQPALLRLDRLDPGPELDRLVALGDPLAAAA